MCCDDKVNEKTPRRRRQRERGRERVITKKTSHAMHFWYIRNALAFLEGIVFWWGKQTSVSRSMYKFSPTLLPTATAYTQYRLTVLRINQICVIALIIPRVCSSLSRSIIGAWRPFYFAEDDGGTIREKGLGAITLKYQTSEISQMSHKWNMFFAFIVLCVCVYIVDRCVAFSCTDWSINIE